MAMLTPEAFTGLTIIVYLLATLAGLAGMLLRRPAWRGAGCWLALAAFFCQTFMLIMGFHKILPAGLSPGAYLQLLAWFFLLCGICAWWRLKHDALVLFAAPFGLILFLMSLAWLDLPISLSPSLTAPFYALHIGALFLGLGLLCVAFIAGLIFFPLQKRLKSKKNMKGFWRDMPALAMLDRINAACVMGAFPLYTIGLLAGLFWARPVFGKTLSGDPKEIASLLVWLLLAILFHNRMAKGWKGRKPALLAIIIFLLSFLSLFAINMLLPTHHAFIRN